MNDRNLDVALRIAADLQDAVRDVDALHAKTAGLKDAGKQAAAGLNEAAGAADKAAGAAKREADAIDQSNARRDRLVNLLQTERGARIQEAEAVRAGTVALGAHNAVMQRQAMTAGELRNAQRQLPTQITDIVTGLASGQSVFMVAIQQGGQLRDTWGGIVPAGRALIGTLSPLVVGLTAGAAAATLIGTALFQAQAEEKAFNDALLMTGNYANVSVQQLEGMVETMAALDAVTAGGARQALLQVASSGKIAGDQFEMVATAAARMEAATGQSIDTTVSKFEEIAQSPVEALLKLNETEHFLTEAQLERVRALIEEGREQDAAAEGARIYADRLDAIATASEAARPHLQRMWQEAKKGASEAWEETKNFAEFLAAAGEKFEEMPWYKKFGPAAGLNAVRALYQAEPAPPLQTPRVAGQVVDSKAEQAKDKARKEAEQKRKEFMAEESRYLSDAARKQKERAEVEDLLNSKIITREEASKRLALIEESYARKAAKKGKTKSEAQQDQEAAQRELENLEKQIALTATLGEGEKQITNEARVQVEIKQGAFQLSSKATKEALLDAAKRRDAQLAEREEEEKRQKEVEQSGRAYDRLRQQLETPVEAAISEVTAQIEVLNKALESGKISAAEYQLGLERVLNQSYTKAPVLRSPFAGQEDLTGLLGDQTQLEEYGRDLDLWRADEIAKNDAHYAQKQISEERHQQRMRQIRDQYESNRSALIEAEGNLQIAATQSIFDSLASIARSAAGEQSESYRVLFAISKGFAAAQAAINMWMSISEAMNTAKHPFPSNLAFMAQAAAQGAQVIAAIRGVSYAPQGYATGGRIVGPGTPTSDSVPIWASRDEHMIRAASATQPGARAFLDDFNERGMPALWDWAGGFAAGGAISAPRERPMNSAGGGASPVNLQNDMTLYLLNDRDQLVEALAKHPDMRKAIVIEVTENGQAIRAGWGSGG